jgi:hypothetical protein
MEVSMRFQEFSRRAVRAVIVGGAGLSIAVPAASARTDPPMRAVVPTVNARGTDVAARDQQAPSASSHSSPSQNASAPQTGHGAQRPGARPDSRRAGASSAELPSKLRNLAQAEARTSAGYVAAKSAPGVDRHASPATPPTASDGLDWGIGALVGAGFAAMVALVALAVVLSRRNRLPAAG